MSIRVGIVGIGFGQAVLLPAFRSDPRVDVQGIAATTAERAARAAGAHGIPRAFAGWRALIEDDSLDAVAIATPPAEQAEIALAALARDRHVFCEKPLADSVAAASAMVDAAALAGVANMVDFMFPEIDVWQRARAILQRGDLGEVRHAAVNWNVETYAVRQGLDSWKTRPAAGGGVLNNFASHSFYYLEWLLGPIASLSCRVAPVPSPEERRETYASIQATFGSGAAAVLSISADAAPPTGHRVEIFGAHGALRLENTTADYAQGFELACGTRETGGYTPVQTGAGTTSGDGRVAAVTPLVRRFCDWIETGTPASPTLRHGLRVQHLLDAARRSAVERRAVDVAPAGQ